MTEMTLGEKLIAEMTDREREIYLWAVDAERGRIIAWLRVAACDRTTELGLFDALEWAADQLAEDGA